MSPRRGRSRGPLDVEQVLGLIGIVGSVMIGLAWLLFGTGLITWSG